jgi:hypothetical protein
MPASARTTTPASPRRAWPYTRPGGHAPVPLRTVLFLTAVGALVLLYLLWWTTYAGIHFQERFVQQPAGAAAEVGGTSMRLLSLRQSTLLADQKFNGVPEQAGSGTTWVVAELEAVQQPDAPDFYCTLELVGPDGRRWEKQTKFNRTLPWCDSKEIASGRSVRFEAIFLVPEQYADQLMGVALMDPSVADRVPVIMPPA